MVDFTYQVQGLRQLERNLDALAEEYGPRNALAALRAPIRAALRPLADDIASNTPVDTGALAESVRITVRMPGRRQRGPHIDSRRHVLVGEVGWRWSRGNSLLGRALALEFGNRRVAAQPVLRPAFDRHSRTIANTFAEEFARSIERTATRLGRRAAAGTLDRR